MLKKLLIGFAALLAFLLALFLALWFGLPWLMNLRAPPRIANTPTLLVQVQSLSQLVSVKYVIEKVVLLEDASTWYGLPLGENRLLMVAHGVVKAGVDLGELKPGDLQVSGQKITLKLPPARITDCYLDDNQTEIVDRKTGLLRTFDKDLEQNARRQAVADIRRAAHTGGILKDADDRARLQLTALFQQLGYGEVEIRSQK